MTGASIATPLPEPGRQRRLLVDSILEQAGRQRDAGDPAGAVHTLSGALGAGLWLHTRLWSALAAAAGPDDYHQVRELWLESPRRCHASRTVLRSVAYAAALAGEQEEARALLRRAIVRECVRGRRLRNRARRWARRLTGRRHQPEAQPARLDAPDLRIYFTLLDAVVDGQRDEKRRCVAALRDHGEQDWLTRL